jgi:hypothetical protein
LAFRYYPIWRPECYVSTHTNSVHTTSVTIRRCCGISASAVRVCSEIAPAGAEVSPAPRCFRTVASEAALAASARRTFSTDSANSILKKSYVTLGGSDFRYWQFGWVWVGARGSGVSTSGRCDRRPAATWCRKQTSSFLELAPWTKVRLVATGALPDSSASLASCCCFCWW